MSRDRQYKLGFFIFALILFYFAESWIETTPSFPKWLETVIMLPLAFIVGAGLSLLMHSKTKQEEEKAETLIEEDEK